MAPVAVEVAYRVSNPLDGSQAKKLDRFRRIARGEHVVYRPLPHTAYGLNPELETVNNVGFRGPDWTVERTPGVPRIVCLGASTTEGGNGAGYEGSYPYLLEVELEEALGRDVEVLNAGVSGWTTAESLVAWFLTLQDYAPDVVVIHHAVNDVMPRNAHGFERNYAHWRRPLHPPAYGWFEHLLVQYSDIYARRRLKDGDGTLAALSAAPVVHPTPFREHGDTYPAESGEPFARNVRSIGESVVADGGAVCLLTMPAKPTDDPEHFASFRVGIAMHNDLLREIALETGWILADADLGFPTDPDVDGAAFLDLVHMTPDGNRAKASLVAGRLAEHWWPAWAAANPAR